MRWKAIFLAAVIVLQFSQTQSAKALSGITIQPIRQELALNPGFSFSNKLRVTNNTKKSQTIYLSAESFDVINENYDYSFSKSEEAFKWVSFDETSAKLKPKESHDFIYTISVPLSAEPGERYIAIFASININGEDVNITNRAGQLSYITIKGHVTKKGNLLNFDYKKLNFDKNTKWQARLQNDGTAHFKTIITSKVFDIFGNNINLSTQSHLILPKTIRKLSGQISIGFWPGIYRVQFKVGRGDLPAQYFTKWVIYLPIWSIALFLVILLIIFEIIKN